MNLLKKYYDYVLEKSKDFTIDEEIVFSIMKDFTDRRGLQQEWENIDADIQEEIIQTWINVVKEKLENQIYHP